MMRPVTIIGPVITTARLRLRPWRPEDAADALEIYGSAEIARWLTPALERMEGLDQMRAVLSRWITDPPSLPGRPAGRWAIEEIETARLAGSGQILPLPPSGVDLELGYQLKPSMWGRGLATEAGHALAHHAFAHGEEEVFAVVRPHNSRGARAARRIGMEWVGETDKYYDLRLQVFRYRKADLDISALDPRPVER